MRNVLNSVIDNKMCMRCGGCVAVCPKHVLKISYNNKTGFFDIKEDKPSCIECGLCMTVCPALKKEYSGSPIGPYKDLCLTFSCNAHVRGNGTSGGVVNELCQLLLETKIVDSVLLVKNSPKNRVWTEPIWIESAEYLKKTPRDFASRYISVPVCSLLQKREKNKKYAIVGTPCQIHSAKKILGKNHFFIGIACSEGISFKATEQYLKCIGKKGTDTMYYRGNGWPGKTTVYCEEKIIQEQEHYISDFNAIYSSQIYRNRGCRFCHDQFAEEADISFFDFWNFEEVKQERQGKSGTIIRTEKAETVMNELIERKKIRKYRNLSEQEIIECQEWVVLLKKKYWNSSMIKAYYFIIDCLKLLHISSKLTVIQYRFLGKIFRYIIYLQKRIKNKDL